MKIQTAMKKLTPFRKFWRIQIELGDQWNYPTVTAKVTYTWKIKSLGPKQPPEVVTRERYLANAINAMARKLFLIDQARAAFAEYQELVDKARII